MFGLTLTLQQVRAETQARVFLYHLRVLVVFIQTLYHIAAREIGQRD